jgi:outer membrane protein
VRALRRHHLPILAATALCAAPAAAQNDDATWFAKPGVSMLHLADQIELSVGGTPVPGADANTKDHYTPTVHVGRFVAENIAISAVVGIPPHIDVIGTDVLAPFGKLAEVTYGPTAVTAQFHPLRSGTIRPYVGAGVAYMLVFSTDDGAFQDVEVDNDIGPVIEAGADIMLTGRYGLSIDVKKAFLRTEARGTFNGAPVVSGFKMDPLVVSVGGVIRF